MVQRKGETGGKEKKEKQQEGTEWAQEMQLLPIPSSPSTLQGERTLEINPAVSFQG